MHVFGDFGFVLHFTIYNDGLLTNSRYVSLFPEHALILTRELTDLRKVHNA